MVFVPKALGIFYLGDYTESCGLKSGNGSGELFTHYTVTVYGDDPCRIAFAVIRVITCSCNGIRS